MTEPASPSNSIIAQRTQEKFDAFLLGLIFTILGLSIQTAKFGVSPVADTSEVLSWVLFLVAGLAGLSRFEWTSEIYRLYGVQDEKEQLKRAAQRAQLEGKTDLYVMPLEKTVSASQYIAEAKDSVTKVGDAIKPLMKRSFIKYRVMKFTFVAGLVALMFARALVPIRGIINAWTSH